MGEIVEFKLAEQKFPPRVWACAHCDHQLHFLRITGDIECGKCGFVFSELKILDTANEPVTEQS